MFIHGSPHPNGNTRQIAAMAAQAARDEDAEVFEIDATRLEFKVAGCAGCMQCQQSDEFACVLGDELALTVAGLVEYDVIVLATPTYWMSYSAQIKMLIDRLGSLMRFGENGEIITPLAGKSLALLTTGNAGLANNLDLLEQQCRNVAEMFACRFSACLFPNMGMVRLGQDEALRAREFGRQLAVSIIGKRD